MRATRCTSGEKREGKPGSSITAATRSRKPELRLREVM